jgi:hypothetical protein
VARQQDDALCPFLLAANGEVDFGTGYEGQDRYYETNILQTELMIGQQVDWRSSEYETIFSIVGITQLA